MTPELQKYYEDRISMFGSKGWKDFIDDVNEMLSSTNRLEGIDTEKALHFRRGELSIIKWILSVEEISRESFKQLEEENENPA